MSEVFSSLIPHCLITTSCYSLAMCVLQELCTGIAWHLAFPAAGIAWLNFLESPPLLACMLPQHLLMSRTSDRESSSLANVSPADFTSSIQNISILRDE